MTDKKLKERNQIPDSYKWNIRAMYPDESKWDSDIEECMTRAEKFGCYRGRLTESASTLLEALRERDSIWEKLEHAFVYAAMKKDEDNRVDRYQAMNDKCGSVIARAAAAMNQSSLVISKRNRVLSNMIFCSDPCSEKKITCFLLPKRTFLPRCQRSRARLRMCLKCSTTLIWISVKSPMRTETE